MTRTILELFAGKQNPERRKLVESRGFKYITLDNNPKFEPDIVADIMTIDIIEKCDFIWASPPCETWSVLLIGRNWNKDNTPKTEKAAYMEKLILHTIKLLKESGTTKWIIENPIGKLRKMPYMQEFSRQSITYCQYGETRMKPTDLWVTGLNWVGRPMCHRKGTCHESAPRGTHTAGTQGMKNSADRAVVPLELWKEILDSLEKQLDEEEMSKM